MRVALDGGHGGSGDTGAQHSDLVEKDLNRDLIMMLANALSWTTFGHHIVRPLDVYLPLSERGERADGSDWTISIHHNAHHNAGIHGAEVYVPHNASQIEVAVAKEILRTMPDCLSTKRVIEAYNDPNKDGDNWLQNPANVLAPHSDHYALLLEVGYISNENDAAVVSSDWGKVAIVAAIMSGLSVALRG